MYCVYKTNVFLITLLEYKLPDHYNIKYIFEEIHAVLNSFWIQYALKAKISLHSLIKNVHCQMLSNRYECHGSLEMTSIKGWLMS